MPIIIFGILLIMNIVKAIHNPNIEITHFIMLIFLASSGVAYGILEAMLVYYKIDLNVLSSLMLYVVLVIVLNCLAVFIKNLIIFKSLDGGSDVLAGAMVKMLPVECLSIASLVITFIFLA